MLDKPQLAYRPRHAISTNFKLNDEAPRDRSSSSRPLRASVPSKILGVRASGYNGCV